MEKKKCLIIHTPRLFYEGKDICSDINYCAMGLFSLASELEKSGFEATILNLGIEKYLDKNFSLSKYINENNVRFAAFSLNWHQQSFDVIETAKEIKQNCPDIFISLGGYTATFFAEEIMRNYPFIDAIIKGEGEKPMTELVNSVFENKSLAQVPNLCYREDNKIISNDNVFVAENNDLDIYNFFNPKLMLHYEEYSKIPYVINYAKENQLNNPASGQGICLGRGCIGNCVWCGGGYITTKLMSGRNTISYRSVQSVINEIKMMKDEYNIEYFNFSFDPNPTDRSYLIDLFNEIAKEFNGNINTIYNLDGLPDKPFINAFKNAFSNKSKLLLSPVFHNEELRKKYKSFFYTNKQLENILQYMDEKEVNSEIYFSIMPGVEDKFNKDSEKYGEYLTNKYEYVTGWNKYNVDIEPASPWTFNPEKFNLKNARKTFKEYYDNTKVIEKSFEKSFCMQLL